MNRPESRTRANASFNWGISGGYCALTSTWGIGGAASHGNRAPTAQHQVRREQHDSRDDRVLHVVEAMVDALPARAEAPACRRPGKAPDGASDRGQDRVARERRFEHAGGNRDERARERRQPADEDGPVLPAAKPAPGPGESRPLEMEPTPAPVDERPRSR